MSKKLLIIGNGFTKDLIDYLDLDINTSSPFSFEVPYPFHPDHQLLERLPHVKDLIEKNPEKSDGDIIQSFLKTFDENEKKDRWLHCQLRYFLALAYADVSKKIFHHWKKRHPQEKIWRWEHWFQDHHHEISGIISLNYDTALEIMLCKLAFFKIFNLEYYRIGSIENFIPKTISKDGQPMSYEITQPENFSRQGIPIFKPHGSCDFDFPSKGISIPPQGRLATLTELNNFSVLGRGMVDVVQPKDLWIPRIQADIVLPFEISKLNQLMWVNQGYETIKKIANNSDHCIIIGVSYQSCDRPELDSILDCLPQTAKKTLILRKANADFEKKLGIQCTSPELFFQDSQVAFS